MVLLSLCAEARAQTEPKEKDTIRIGNIIITRDPNKSSDYGIDNTHIIWGKRHNGKLSNVSTNWLILDFGMANYVDETNYNAPSTYLYNRPGAVPLGKNDFDLREGKSVNVNIWFFIQRLNLIKHYVNLKYGLGIELNNYRYTTNANISYLENNPYVPPQYSTAVIIRDSIQFSKNKLALDYLTVPLMLNFSTNPGYLNKGLSLSVGVSAGYLYDQRNKQISPERGKLKNKHDFDIETFKFSYIAELGLGPVKLYGSYSPVSFYERDLDMKPYTIGIRFSNW